MAITGRYVSVRTGGNVLVPCHQKRMRRRPRAVELGTGGEHPAEVGTMPAAGMRTTSDKPARTGAICQSLDCVRGQLPPLYFLIRGKYYVSKP